MFLDVTLLVAGLTLILVGANWLTDGSVIVARRFRVPELVIGLTIIAIGTSAPELVVSLSSALSGNTEMAVGNVIGSNIFNALMIIGITVLVRPIRLSRENSFKNIPLAIITTLFFVAVCASVFGASFMPARITRIEGVLLLVGFAYFMSTTVRSTRTERKAELSEEQIAELNKKIWLAVPMILVGLSALVFGGDMFLKHAVSLATHMGVSEYIISVTLMAGGTSLPELAACVVAARKGKSQLALGNVIGSNISNILLVLGAASAIHPLNISGVSSVDLVVLVISSVLLFVTPFTFRRHTIDRVEGVILIAVYLLYVFYLLY